MILLPTILMLITRQPEPDLVFSARYYYQGNRSSYHQIYLVNHTGKGRRQVTNNNFDSAGATWIDRNHLAWVEVYEKLPTKEPGEEPLFRMRVMTLDLKTNKRRKIAEIPPHEAFWGPSVGDSRVVVNTNGPDSTLIETTYKISLSGIKVVPNRESRMMDEEFGDGAQSGMGDTLGDAGKVMLKTKRGPWALHWTVHSPNMVSDSDSIVAQNWVEMRSTWKKKTLTFRLHGNHVQHAYMDSSGSPVILTTYAHEKYRHDNYLYRLSKDLTSITKVSGKVGMIHLQKDRHLWSGHQPGVKEAAMEKLEDGRQVYVFWLYVGDWKTGQQWTIANGLVDVTAHEFRPLT